MNARMAATALTTVLRTADNLDVAIPDTLRGTLEAAITAARDATHTQAEVPDLAGLIATAIAEGRDPLKDTTVREAAVDHTILNALGPGAIAAALAERAAVVARDNAPAIVAAFKPRYAELGRLLAEDHATMAAAGVDDLDHARQSVRAGTDTARAHARALETMSTLAAIDNALALLRSFMASDGTPVGSVVRTVDAPDAAPDELRKFGLNPSHWQIVGQGWTLDLATPDEAAQRYARAYEVQASHDRDADERGRAAIRTRYGTGQAVRL